MFEVDLGKHILLEVFLYNRKTAQLLITWVHPQMFGGVCVAHLFSFLLHFYFVCLHSVYPILPVSLDCPFLVTPSVFSNVYLTSSKQYFSYIHDKNELTVYKQYIMQVHWWHYIYIITFLVSNVPCVSGLSILDLPLRLQFSLSYICCCIMVIGIHVYWIP